MSFRQKSSIPGLLILTLLLGACGNLFRPIATPIISPPGDPESLRFGIVLSTSNTDASTANQVNVGGDTLFRNRLVGRGAVHGVTQPNGLLYWIVNQAESTVSMLPLQAAFADFPAAVATLPPGSEPTQVVCTVSNIAWVVNRGTATVARVDASNAIVTNVIPVGKTAGGASVRPVALAQLPNGGNVYTANSGENTVSIIDTANLIVGANLDVGVKPVWIATNADGTLVFVLNQGDGTTPGTLSVIETASNTLTSTLTLGLSPNFMMFEPRLARLYVTNPGSNTVTVIRADTATPVVITNVAVGTAPVMVSANPDGSRLYVANSGSNDVSVIQTSSNTILHAAIPVGTNPVALAVDSTGTKVLVANKGANSISVIHTNTDTVVVNLTQGVSQPVWVSSQ